MEHYSDFPEAPDRESSTLDYRSRFSGPVGSWFLSVQTGITRDIARALAKQLGRPLSILDVGGGHAQNLDLLEDGHKLVVLGSDESCGTLLTAVDSDRFEFRSGSLLQLPFAENEFDLVISYRILAHIGDWQLFLTELARVSRYQVAVDYPTTQSFNMISSFLYRVKKRMEANTREYRLFTESGLAEGVASAGMTPYKRCPQFFFPMAMHRVLKLASFSRFMEACARVLQLHRFFGSPVIAVYAVPDTASL